MSLNLGDGLRLPTDAVTETFAILAMRGAGKTNLARCMAEEMFREKLHFAVIDPVGSWWGLRASRDGKSPGLPIPILGGPRGDLPLEKTGGALVADLIVNDSLTCIVDVSEFSHGECVRFLTDLAERIYRKNRDALHLFLEECDEYTPQNPMRDEPRLLRAWELIVRRGRARGLGVTMITQRSAKVNKNVLTQIGSLFAMRTTSPQDRAAIKAWVEYNAESKDLIESLQGLENGEAWFWSPAWRKVCQRFKARLSHTYDSGATPKSGRKSRAPATLQDVNLGAIRQAMADTIEKAKADDPRLLRKRIAELERLAAKPAVTKPVDGAAVVEKEVQKRLKASQKELCAGLRKVLARASHVKSEAQQLQTLANELLDSLTLEAPAPPPKKEPAVTKQTQTPKKSQTQGYFDLITRAGESNGEALPAGELAVLTASAQYVGGCTLIQLSGLTGYKRSSRNTYVQRLRTRGYVQKVGDRIVATDEGIEALGEDFKPLPTGEALQEYWLGRLQKGEADVLKVLIAHYPDAVSREEISDRIGAKRSSRDTYIQRLKAKEIIELRDGGVAAAPSLFE